MSTYPIFILHMPKNCVVVNSYKTDKSGSGWISLMKFDITLPVNMYSLRHDYLTQHTKWETKHT